MRTIWVIVTILVLTIILGTIGILIGIFEKRGRALALIARIWSKCILWSSGVRYRVTGLENLESKENYIFAGNHESAFDIPLAYAALPYQMVSIAKKELARIPLFGWAMSTGQHIFVDRRNHAKALESMKKAEESLTRNPRSILLFPEGTRSLDGEIKRFKPGGLILGIQTDMEIVPMAFCGTSDVNLKGSLKLSPRTIELRIGKPVPTRTLTYDNRNELAEKVRGEVIMLKTSWQEEQKN